MPRCFLNIEHTQPLADELREQLPNYAAAWAEALRAHARYRREAEAGDRWSVEVRRHSKPICRISVTTELEIANERE
jgi:acyl-CoA thioesterase FadM